MSGESLLCCSLLYLWIFFSPLCRMWRGNLAAISLNRRIFGTGPGGIRIFLHSSWILLQYSALIFCQYQFHRFFPGVKSSFFNWEFKLQRFLPFNLVADTMLVQLWLQRKQIPIHRITSIQYNNNHKESRSWYKTDENLRS